MLARLLLRTAEETIGREVLVAAATAIVTVAAEKLVERLIDRWLPAPASSGGNDGAK